MEATAPEHPKLFHIIHVDNLASVLEQGGLWSDARMRRLQLNGTGIGMSHIKERRLRAPLASRPGLHVGECVPFYFCPRSVMLYLVHCRNHPDLSYTGGQGPILHLRADLRQVVEWADANDKRWAFTSSNAGSNYFDDWCDLARLDRIDWNAVRAREWAERSVKEGKQAEFLLEDFFPWHLVEGVAAQNEATMSRARSILAGRERETSVKCIPAWYY